VQKDTLASREVLLETQSSHQGQSSNVYVNEVIVPALGQYCTMAKNQPYFFNNQRHHTFVKTVAKVSVLSIMLERIRFSTCFISPVVVQAAATHRNLMLLISLAT